MQQQSFITYINNRMKYIYPRPQNLYNNTVFLIADTVNSDKFDEYSIPYRKENSIIFLNMTHVFLKECIDRGIVVLLEKPGSFHGKSFYRIPVNIQLTLY